LGGSFLSNLLGPDEEGPGASVAGTLLDKEMFSVDSSVDVSDNDEDESFEDSSDADVTVAVALDDAALAGT
jgi:hypothetical protein